MEKAPTVGRSPLYGDSPVHILSKPAVMEPAIKRVPWAERLKILGVIQYTCDLFRGYARPSQFTTLRPRDYVFKLFAAVWPTWSSPEGYAELALFFFLAFARAWLLHRSADTWREVSRAVFKGDTGRFYGLVRRSAVLSLLGSLYHASLRLAQDRLQIIFRGKLTKQIHELYFRGMNFYQLPQITGPVAIPDPEERLCREVSSVASRLSNIVALTTQALPTLVWFFFRIYKAAGVHYALLPMTYHFVAYEVTQRYFPKDIGLLYREYTAESSEYRKQCGRVQRHGEAIAALGGAAAERQLLETRFDRVQGVLRRAQWQQIKFDAIFKLAYTNGFLPIIYLFVYLTPWLAGGALGRQSLGGASNDQFDLVSTQMSDVRQVVHMLIEMLVAEGKLMTTHATCLHIQGIAKRVTDFLASLQTLEDAQAKACHTTFTESDLIAFQHVKVETPTGHKLVEDLSFELPKGTSLLLTGHNGAGKSSIFRCLGGLWQVPQGTIAKPGAGTKGLHGSVFYLPQKPYNVYGTLRDQLTYPRPPEDVQISDHEMRELLYSLELKHLLEDGAPNEVRNWEQTLSLGEQQRLAMARLFFHRPEYVVLDECTSAVDARVESMLYERCISMGITYITISHRPTLKAFHDAELHLTGDGQGGWRWGRIDRDAEFHKMQKRFSRGALSNGCLKGTQRTGPSAPSSPRTPSTPSSQGTNGRLGRALEERTRHYTAEVEKKRMPIPSPTAWSRLICLAKIALPGTGKQVTLLLALIIARTLFREFHAIINGRMAAHMVRGAPGRLAALTFFLVLQDLVCTSLETMAERLEKSISLSWHHQLQSHVTKLWLSKRRFFTLALDGRIKDADQILSQEMSDFAQLFSSIWGSLVKPGVDLIWFTSRLLLTLGGGGTLQLNLYSLAVGAILRLALPNHSALAQREKEAESKYRFVQGRLRDHSESIAFFGGGPLEKRLADGCFGEVCEASLSQKTAEGRYKFLYTLLAREPEERSTFLSTPLLLQAWLQLCFARGVTGNKDSLARGTTYVDIVIEHCIGAFSKLASVFEDAAKLSGASARVTGLLAILDELGVEREHLEGGVREVSDGSIAFEEVDLVTPTGVCLAKELTFELPPGRSMMITGPNSSGKTSLFRILAGMWPLHKGTVRCPRGVMLVPQRVYSVSGTLLDQVTYPQQFRPVTPEQMEQALAALKQVGIAYLAEREGWDKELKWEDVLSLGEQQRLGFARLFFHSPQVGILDECTSAVSMDAEERMMAALHQAGISCVTLSQRLALEQFHHFELQLAAPTPKGWWFGPVRESEGETSKA